MSFVDLRAAFVGASSSSWIFVLLVALSAAPAESQTLEPIRYTVSFPAPHTHYVEVEASVPTDGRPQIELMMAVWTPGSYLVREYARHVEALTATDAGGVSLPVEKTRKNRWRIATTGARTIRLAYRVYAHEMSVRTNWVDEEFALLNGAPTFITLVESPSRRPHEVRVLLPTGWAQSFSGMQAGTAQNTYTAPDYDTLVDSPIVAGDSVGLSVPGRWKASLSCRLPGARRLERAAGCPGSREDRRNDVALLGGSSLRPVLFLQHHRLSPQWVGAQEFRCLEHPARIGELARWLSRLAESGRP